LSAPLGGHELIELLNRHKRLSIPSQPARRGSCLRSSLVRASNAPV
jgi:hypothetical protein